MANVYWEVFERHLDEAAFLWERWERSLLAPDYVLAEVASTEEERLHAHLDALHLGGADVAEQLLAPALGESDPARTSSAAYALLPSGTTRVTSALRDGAPEQRTAIARAVGLSPHRELEPAFRTLLEVAEPSVQAIALRVLAFRGLDAGNELRAFLASADPDLRAAALTAARWSKANHHVAVEDALRAQVPAVRDAAIETGLVLGYASAYAACRALVAGHGHGAGLAAQVLGMSGDDEDLDRLRSGLDAPALRPAVLFALGFSGRPEAAELCIQYMADLATAALAGEAFAAITGLAIQGEYEAEGSPAADEPIPLEEENLDADLVPGPEAALPVPSPDAVAAWWKRERARFQPRTRYLRGRPFGPQELPTALTEEPMRRRYTLALELALRSRGEYLVDTRTWARDQARFLASRRLDAAPGFGMPLKRLLQS